MVVAGSPIPTVNVPERPLPALLVLLALVPLLLAELQPAMVMAVAVSAAAARASPGLITPPGGGMLMSID
jgi:hypothetical protein